MITNAVIPLARRAMSTHPALMGMATATSGFIRQMSIKTFSPRLRRREMALRHELPSIHTVRNHLFKEKGQGEVPTIVIGGFVPDATEAVEFQREIFRRHGSVYYINFSRSGFSAPFFFAQLADLIEELNRKGQKPVIFSVSFGCSLVARFFRDGLDAGLSIRGTVMTSPVLCIEDLVRPEGERRGGVRMLESNLKRILRAETTKGDELNRQIERARRCFQALFEAGAENRVLSNRHLSIRKRIMGVLESTSCLGGYERVMALRDAPTTTDGTVFGGPALVLLAEKEDELLVHTSPTLAALRDSEIRARLFPRGKVRTVMSPASGDAVAHASLIFHQHCYNPLIEAWYDRLTTPLRLAVVS
ncbi:alpha/beta hydrolase [Geobacter grbiciae]|uniref:alpha/beta hydrolase n=1 Tax=Geobacter grbiciae TaxID=155042 RepID=UPI001C00B262|nr:alpha/beta hydrolase [Geobacter grbiciae]MBT1075747.1 alpha/beta hydrolase [Geobacter grbiciae]